MNDTVTEAKAELIRAKDRILRALAKTPDEKINWSPAPTARTAVQQVAHVAMSITGIQGMLTGKPFPFANTAELDASLRKSEAEFSTREQVISLIESETVSYNAWLDTLTPEQIASTITMPFGDFPLAAAITFPADHIRGHAAQIDYLQTIWGDLDWYM